MVEEGMKEYCHDPIVDSILTRGKRVGVPSRELERTLIAAAQGGDQIFTSDETGLG